jgi:CHRD domain
VKKSNRSLMAAAFIAAFAITATVARAETIQVKANLKAASEVPPKDSPGAGTLIGTLDTSTDEFKYHVEFSGLTGPVIAAHFHGPAAEGANAKPQLPVKGGAISSPIDGDATLTAEQVKDLVDGKWYFNLHTQANPGGEIRGQIQKAK